MSMAGSGKTEKVSVTLPRELAGEILSIVSQRGLSAFFTEALEHYLAHRKQRIALEKGFGAWEDRAHPDLNTPQDTTAYIRRLRNGERLERARGTGAE